MINSHLGIEHTWHDDLESLAHVLIYFLHGSLPWQHLEGGLKKQRYHRVMQRKINIPTVELCSGLPNKYQIFLNYTCGLSFKAKPDYEYMRLLFWNLFIARGYQNDSNFDWRWVDLSHGVSLCSGSDTGSNLPSN